MTTLQQTTTRTRGRGRAPQANAQTANGILSALVSLGVAAPTNGTPALELEAAEFDPKLFGINAEAVTQIDVLWYFEGDKPNGEASLTIYEMINGIAVTRKIGFINRAAMAPRLTLKSVAAYAQGMAKDWPAPTTSAPVQGTWSTYKIRSYVKPGFGRLTEDPDSWDL